ncbi:hypothetical protein FAGKG844_20294 [Frankia sp. AgKG'84/4]
MRGAAYSHGIPRPRRTNTGHRPGDRRRCEKPVRCRPSRGYTRMPAKAEVTGNGCGHPRRRGERDRTRQLDPRPATGPARPLCRDGSVCSPGRDGSVCFPGRDGSDRPTGRNGRARASGRGAPVPGRRRGFPR